MISASTIPEWYKLQRSLNEQKTYQNICAAIEETGLPTPFKIVVEYLGSLIVNLLLFVGEAVVDLLAIGDGAGRAANRRMSKSLETLSRFPFRMEVTLVWEAPPSLAAVGQRLGIDNLPESLEQRVLHLPFLRLSAAEPQGQGHRLRGLAVTVLVF